MARLRRRPLPEGTVRNRIAAQRRASALEYSSFYAAVPTRVNLDEGRFADKAYVTSFTKGFAHDDFGQVADEKDYDSFVNHINAQDAENFDRLDRGIQMGRGAGHPDRPAKTARHDANDEIVWRGWESPRAGHYFELQGPDADAVGMPPAPELGSEELTAEMAEVYALALLRDVPFGQIAGADHTDPDTEMHVSAVMNALAKLSWFTESNHDESLQKARRRAARRVDPDRGSNDDFSDGYDIDEPDLDTPFERSKAFRGSGPACKVGPYLSQYMLIGNQLVSASGNEDCNGTASLPYGESLIAYGTQMIDQKVRTFKAGEDFMIHWSAYLDVQNGANFLKDTDAQLSGFAARRFIATPRDLAAYVRYDALYQAYLNACLFMLASGNDTFDFQKPVAHPYSGALGPGLPDGFRRDPSLPDGQQQPESRQAFAQFGGPHVLSLVTEVATRCLKAVRRQKFNYHRRARPERIGALLTLAGTRGSTEDRSTELAGDVLTQLQLMSSSSNLADMLALVAKHNASQLAAGAADPHLGSFSEPSWFTSDETGNYLLPMAFAEGSPMHPSYGAGHATVAGGCVTMLKAFFHTMDETGRPVPWPAHLDVVQASADGSTLVAADGADEMTISGELNKLAANISIGRNMAGVHYYTDYYESLRMGERIATGILIEQMKHYNEPVELNFESFDGDHVHILKNDYDVADPRVYVQDASGRDVGIDVWWHRHQTEESTSKLKLLIAPLYANIRRTEVAVEAV